MATTPNDPVSSETLVARTSDGGTAVSVSGAPLTHQHPNKKDLSVNFIALLRQRVSRAAVVFLLVAVTLLGVAAVALANSPAVLPVEPDGGIGGEVILPVEPDGGIGD